METWAVLDQHERLAYVQLLYAGTLRLKPYVIVDRMHHQGINRRAAYYAISRLVGRKVIHREAGYVRIIPKKENYKP